MSNELLNSLLKEYDHKKTKAELDLENRKKELFQKIPILEEIENEINKCAIETSKVILSNGGTKSIDTLYSKINDLKNKKNNILLQNNISPNYLKPFYECKFCNDTGYIQTSNYKTEMCSCLKQKLINASFSKSNLSNIDKQNFSTFNVNYFSDEVNIEKYKSTISPRENILNIKAKCEEFIDNFDNPNYHNLLFTGNTGLR